MDATKLYGYSMIQPLPYDEIEMWHGHPDLYMKWIDKISNTPDDKDIGYLVEVDLKYTDNRKKKTKNFPFAPENRIIPEDKHNDYMKKIYLLYEKDYMKKIRNLRIIRKLKVHM